MPPTARIAPTAEDRPARFPLTKVPWRLVVFIFLAALAVRIVVLVVHPPNDDGDQRLYRTLAHGLATASGYVTGDDPDTFVHPLLPLLVAIASFAIPDDHDAAMVVTLVIGSLLPAVAAWVVGAAFGSRAAVLTGALLVLQPHHALAAARLEPDLLAASLGFVLSAMLLRSRWGWAGAVVGLAYLNRPEAVFWLPAALAWGWVRGASLRSLALLFLTAALFASPFLLYLRAVEGRWALSGKDHWQYMLGVHQYRSGDQPLPLEQVPGMMRDVGSALSHLQSRPAEFFAGYAYRAGLVLRNIGRQTGYGLLVVFAVIGVAVGLKKTRHATMALLVPLVSLPVLPLVGTFFRHSQVPAAVILAFAGIGVAHLVERRASTQR